MSERSLVIYVDVDDTFVRSFGAKRIAMPSVLEHVKDWRRVEVHPNECVSLSLADCRARVMP